MKPNSPNQDSVEDQLPLKVAKTNAQESAQPWKKRLHFRGRRRLLLLPLLLGLLILGFSIFRSASKGSSADEAATPPTPQAVFALGRLEPEGEIVQVSGPSGVNDARIESLNVSEGSEVEKGEILAVLDNERRLKAAVKVAEDSVAQAKAELARTRLDVQTTSAQLAAALRSEEANLNTKLKTLERFRKSYQARAISSEEMDEAELQADTAKLKVEEAKAKLDRYLTNDDGPPVDVRLSESGLAIAESSLLQARENLEQAYVRAPETGQILRILLRPGEKISQSELLEMGNTRSMMARVEVYESEVPSLTLGQAATLSATTLAKDLHGTVVHISNLVRQQEIVDSDPAANTDARVVEVWVQLDEASQSLAARFVNLQVRVRFQL